MELLAVIEGLKAIKNTNQQITIYSDSKYVVDSVEKGWVFSWVKKAFKDKKNKDLWLQYLELHKLHQIKFIWIKGHNDHPENERCDRLAVFASQNKAALAIDKFFETEKNNQQNIIE
jgi:ribonuclease HI